MSSALPSSLYERSTAWETSWEQKNKAKNHSSSLSAMRGLTISWKEGAPSVLLSLSFFFVSRLFCSFAVFVVAVLGGCLRLNLKFSATPS